MKTTLTSLEGLKRSLKVELPIDTFNQKTDKIIELSGRKIKILDANRLERVSKLG